MSLNCNCNKYISVSTLGQRCDINNNHILTQRCDNKNIKNQQNINILIINEL